MPIQILITIIAIIALIGTFIRFRKATLSRKEFIFWLVLWVAVTILVWNPTATNVIARFLGVGRGADAVFYISIVLLFYTIFRLYAKLENLEHKLSELVKKIALKDMDSQESKTGDKTKEKTQGVN